MKYLIIFVVTLLTGCVAQYKKYTDDGREIAIKISESRRDCGFLHKKDKKEKMQNYVSCVRDRVIALAKEKKFEDIALLEEMYLKEMEIAARFDRKEINADELEFHMTSARDEVGQKIQTKYEELYRGAVSGANFAAAMGAALQQQGQYYQMRSLMYSTR